MVVPMKRPDEVTWTAKSWCKARLLAHHPGRAADGRKQASTMPMAEIQPPSDVEMPAARTWTSCEAPDFLISEHRVALPTVTFCSQYSAIAIECVDRFVDRAICAVSAIGAIGGTAPWYPCRQRLRCAGPYFS